MKTKIKKPLGKIFLGVVLVGMISSIFLLLGNSSLVAAQEGWTETPAFTETPTETPVPVSSDYYSVNPLALSDGTVVQELIIHGPSVPPPGFEAQMKAIPLQEILSSAGSNILSVPAFNWVYGCSAVSGAMIAGYYDRNGYPNMYTGPTNGGVMPMTDSSWSTWLDVSNTTYPNNPLIASHLGVDGKATRGSIDDYWVQYSSTTPDPYITNGWTQHTWGEAIGDYMRTSQSHFNGSTTYGLNDAYTRFYVGSTAAPLQCSYMENNYLPAGYPPDGTLGRKQFYQARGYTVTDCYYQSTDNIIPGGFSFAQYKAEIDAGRPVMINLTGHTIVGVGYADPDTVYLNDTWNSLTHSMTWGGSYSGMNMEGVSIVNLKPLKYTDITVYRGGAWMKYDFNTGNQVGGVWTGKPSSGCIPALMDYDGDGVKEYSQLCDGAWLFYNDNGTLNKGIWTGGMAGDLPVPGDYNGDGTDEVVVWHNGAWLFFNFSTGVLSGGVWTGAPTYNGMAAVTVPMDYDGNGTTDFTVYGGGPWLFYNSNGTLNKGIWTGGVAGDLPVPGDYNGDGTDEVVVWHSGAWLIFNFNNGVMVNGVWTGAPMFNGMAALPAPLDYDKDGGMDYTTYSGGSWLFYNDNGTLNKGIWTGGVAGDLPISRRYLP